jgi:hypothetical protein
MDGRRWNRVSDEAKDLVSKLLEVNPSEKNFIIRCVKTLLVPKSKKIQRKVVLV